VCQHRLGVAGVPLTAIKAGSSHTLRLFEPRVDISTGTVTLTIHAAELPPLITAPDTRYVDKRIHDVDERGRSIAADQLRIFYDGLSPAMPALNNVHCPLLGPYLPGGWFSRIRPAATSTAAHMRACMDAGLWAADITADTFVDVVAAQLGTSALLPATHAVLRALGCAATALAATHPYAVDHTNHGRRNNNENG
jgi:hypothetical protein